MKLKHFALCLPVLFYGSVGYAAPDAAKVNDILKTNNCLACHSVDTKVVGPSYKEIAAKYKGDADEAAQMATRIKKGSSGVWGPIPMPPNPGISEEDVKTVVDWIMAGAPQ